LAVVIRSGGKIAVFALGTAADIDSAVARYRSHFQNPSGSEMSRSAYAAAAEDLRRLVWEPLASPLANAKMIFVAPDGALSLVSFAGLLDSDGNYLIEQYAFHYLLSGRDLLDPVSTAPRGSGLLAMGDPDYDAPPASRTGREVSNRLLAGLQGALATLMPRNVTSGCRALRDRHVARLRRPCAASRKGTAEKRRSRRGGR